MHSIALRRDDVWGGASPANRPPTVFSIDEDHRAQAALATRCAALGLASRPFDTAEDFLRFYDGHDRGCVVTELRLHGMSGVTLVEEMVERGFSIPIIILTQYGDTQSAVRALKGGAFDFVEKPIDGSFYPRVEEAVAAHAACEERRRRYATVRARFGGLTERERQVMSAVIEGKANKVIAYDLGLSEKTIEAHRARVMQKLQVGSLAELVRVDALAELTQASRSNGVQGAGRLTIVRPAAERQASASGA